MVIFLDKLKKIGFDYATSSGISISPLELEKIVDKKKNLIQAYEQISQIEDYYQQGFYSQQEVYQRKISVWAECKDNLESQLINNLNEKKDTSFYTIWESGARASSENLTQIFAMRGNTTNYLGEIIETPITSSL
jgi:DNA-directed RNA polymerase subunit beta'